MGSNFLFKSNLTGFVNEQTNPEFPWLQELDKWQTDMEQLLEGQMRQRLIYGEKVTNYRTQTSSAMSTCSDTGSVNTETGSASRKTSFISSLFQRS